MSSFTSWLTKAAIAIAVLSVGVIFIVNASSQASAAEDENKIVVRLQETIVLKVEATTFEAMTEPGDWIERVWVVTNTSKRNNYCLVTWASWEVTEKRTVHLNTAVLVDGISVPGVIQMAPGTKKRIALRVTIGQTTPQIAPETDLTVILNPPVRTSCPTEKG